MRVIGHPPQRLRPQLAAFNWPLASSDEFWRGAFVTFAVFFLSIVCVRPVYISSWHRSLGVRVEAGELNRPHDWKLRQIRERPKRPKTTREIPKSRTRFGPGKEHRETHKPALKVFNVSPTTTLKRAELKIENPGFCRIPDQDCAGPEHHLRQRRIRNVTTARTPGADQASTRYAAPHLTELGWILAFRFVGPIGPMGSHEPLRTAEQSPRTPRRDTCTTLAPHRAP